MPTTTVHPPGEQVSGSASSVKVSIVAIENSPHDAHLIREALDLWTRPHDLVFYSDGLTAIEALKETAPVEGQPCLVLLDWNMPGMHGSKVLKQLREEKLRDHVGGGVHLIVV